MVGPKPLTTGEIAKHCGVNLRTVARWIERGELKAYQLPGRGDNRVEVPDFLDFLRRNALPLPEAFRSRRVLVVEDDPDLAELMKRALERAGFETRLAADGFAAGTLLGTFHPSVVTVDLRMAGLGGLEVIRQIRANPRLGGIRILVVSAMPPGQLEEARKAGADGVLAKPFESSDLVGHVSALSEDRSSPVSPA